MEERRVHDLDDEEADGAGGEEEERDAVTVEGDPPILEQERSIESCNEFMKKIIRSYLVIHPMRSIRNRTKVATLSKDTLR